MRRFLVFVFALSCFCGCVIEKGELNSVTSDELKEYGDARVVRNIVQPSNELATYLFIDEYRVLDDEQRAVLADKYGLSGKVSQQDEQTFKIGNYGIVMTAGKSFAETGWRTGWKMTGLDQWRKDGVDVTVIRDSEGLITGFTVFSEPSTEVDRHYKRIGVSFPDGPVTVNNTLKYCFDKYSLESGNLYNNGYLIKISGKVRIEIYELTRLLDWVEITSNENGVRSYKTSRD